MSWREEMVASLIALLAPITEANRAAVERMPDKPSYELFKHPAAAVWVGYHGIPKASQPNPGGVQDGVAHFDLTLLTRKLNGPKGSLELVDMIEQCVLAKRLDRGSPIFWVSDGFGGTENGIWRYDVVLGVQLPIVPVSEPDPGPFGGPAPPLKFALLEDEVSGDTSVGTDPGA